MVLNECQFMIDSCSKFHSCLYIEGWFFSVADQLRDVRLAKHQGTAHVKVKTGYDHGGVLSSLGPGLGFKLEIMFEDHQADYLALSLIFTTLSGKIIEVALRDLVRERLTHGPVVDLGGQFKELLRGKARAGGRPKVLDIGGRSRSGLDRSRLFPDCDVVVLDILPGENVDVVGDAHELGRLFPAGYFDAVYSVYVFEHLFMPWKVALEINKILKPGGVGAIFTHQTIAMHDMPWDFFRFSDTAWDSLFNRYTGFRIVSRCLDSTQYVIPFILREDKMDAEKSAGFEASAVLFEKTGETSLTWDVRLRDVIGSMYPDTPYLGIEIDPQPKNVFGIY